MNKETKYFSIIFALIVLYLSFLLVRPFISPLITAIIVSYILYPFYNRLNNKVKNKNLSIFLIILFILLVAMVTTSFIIYSLIDDISGLINFLRNLDLKSLSFIKPEWIPTIESYLVKIPETLILGLLPTLSKLSEVFDSFINVVIFFFLMTLFLKNGSNIVKKFKIVIPIEKIQKEALIGEFQLVTKNMIHSLVLSMISNGIIGGLVFYFFSIPNAVLWGFTIGMLSFIPIISNTPIWIGGMIYLILSGQYLFSILFALLGLLISQAENLIIMKIVGEKSKINSFIVLIGIISGVKSFGLLGLILGPFVLSLLITLIRFYTKNYKKEFDS